MIPQTKTVDLMVTVHNRAEFTRECLLRLVKNTSWKDARKLSVYDVCSKDGARQVVKEALLSFNEVPYEVVDLPLMGIHDVQNLHVMKAEAPFVAKIDNDIAVPPGWLEVALSIFGRYPEIGILGLSPIFGIASGEIPADGYGHKPYPSVGGIFLAKTSVFREAPRLPKGVNKYYGFQEWQQSVIPSVKKSFVEPGIPVVLLDMLPIEPWASLGRKYVERGWQRTCKPYSPEDPILEWWKRREKK